MWLDSHIFSVKMPVLQPAPEPDVVSKVLDSQNGSGLKNTLAVDTDMERHAELERSLWYFDIG
jgi:hypothetical protein